jgi:hypothetical protein
MNMKLRVTFIIIITLVLGIVVGFMLNRIYSQRRVRNILSRRSPDFFVAFYERILEPDTEQSKKIREILDTYSKQVTNIRENFQAELQSLFESMKAQIEPILTPEQKERLKERFPQPPPYRDLPGIKRGLDRELAALKERLHLSEDQTSRIKQVFERFSMLPGRMWGEMRFPGGWRMPGEMRFPRGMNPIIERQKKVEKAIQEILTEEQKELFKQIKKERLERLKEEMKRYIEMIEKEEPPGFWEGPFFFNP